ncbi:immunoglobulin E-set [Pelagophyceae sp. CCMP2097]|nr:immunoglobulin E-set [Pelagophyceae sp. CCMP2097]
MMGSDPAVELVNVDSGLFSEPAAEPRPPRRSGVQAPCALQKLEARAAGRRTVGSLFFYAVRVEWLWFWLAYIISFLAANVFFALLYLSCGDPALDTFASGFNLSVQTLSTVGFGHLRPTTHLTQAVFVLETAAGLAYVASVTGLVFARVSKPSQNLAFSSIVAVAANDRGDRVLALRVASRQPESMLLNVEASLTCTGAAAGAAVVPLVLDASRVAVFPGHCVFNHTIDTDSPLQGLDEDNVLSKIAFLELSLLATDATYMQTVFANCVYSASDLRFDRHFSAMAISERGRTVLDHDKIDDIRPVQRSDVV